LEVGVQSQESMSVFANISLTPNFFKCSYLPKLILIKLFIMEAVRTTAEGAITIEIKKVKAFGTE
jgi:hypothetical protein